MGSAPILSHGDREGPGIASFPMAHLKPWPPSINALTWIRALNRRRIDTLLSVGHSLSFPFSPSLLLLLSLFYY